MIPSPTLSSRAAAMLGALAVATLAALPAHAAVLFDNGSPSTGAVASTGELAPDGTTWAQSQGGTIGWTNSLTSAGTRFTLADDFTIAAGSSWTIASIDVMAYVTDVSIAASPIRGVALQVWSGTPGTAGASVVWGDLTTDRMTASNFSGIYRSELDYPDLQRPLWTNSVSTTGLVLGAGTYWIEYLMITGSTSTRAFGVPVHVDGQTAAPGANGLQSSFVASTGAASWTPLVDTGVQQAQDIPFVIHGTVAAVPEPATAALWLLGALGVAATVRRRRA